jgi:hypothetical protein
MSGNVRFYRDSAVATAARCFPGLQSGEAAGAIRVHRHQCGIGTEEFVLDKAAAAPPNVTFAFVISNGHAGAYVYACTSFYTFTCATRLRVSLVMLGLSLTHLPLSVWPSSLAAPR